MPISLLAREADPELVAPGQSVAPPLVLSPQMQLPTVPITPKSENPAAPTVGAIETAVPVPFSPQY